MFYIKYITKDMTALHRFERRHSCSQPGHWVRHLNFMHRPCSSHIDDTIVGRQRHTPRLLSMFQITGKQEEFGLVLISLTKLTLLRLRCREDVTAISRREMAPTPAYQVDAMVDLGVQP